MFDHEINYIKNMYLGNLIGGQFVITLNLSSSTEKCSIEEEIQFQG